MGIGNRRAGAALATSAALSLPLMGIGNLEGEIEIVATNPGAHYPSWGSETQAESGQNRKLSDSLPLMGIGNLARLSEHLRGYVHVSLPLMGIGNPTSLRRSGCISSAFSLPLMGIGNSETGSGGGVRVSLCRSLPLMGIGNRGVEGQHKP